MKPFRLTSLIAAPKPYAPRSIGGQTAQRAGSNFQKVIMWSAGVHKDVVSLEELPPFGARRVGGGKTVYLPICCDFVGAIIDVVGLFFDAKSTDDDNSLNVKTFILSKRHQLDFLRKMCSAGQAAGYLVECKALRKYLWIDVLYVVDDAPIRFARDGKLCKPWVDCGPTTLAVDFTKIKETYLAPPPAKVQA